MSYQFNPLNDEELEKASEYSLVDDGIYNFKVIKSTRKVSKSGNPMAELQITIWDSEGKERTVFDYLVFSTINLNIRKIKHFCDSVMLHEEYKKGELPENLENYCGKLEIGMQDAQPKSGGGFYPKKNIVVDYVLTDKGAVKHDNSEPFFDDDSLPF